MKTVQSHLILYVMSDIGALAVLQGIIIAGCKSVIGYIFTSDE